MNQILLEILHQKRATLLLALALLLLNVAVMAFDSLRLAPAVAAAHAKWSSLRSQLGRTGQVDAVTLYRQGTVDLERIRTKIPPKREFARVLSELLESAAGSGVSAGPFTYKPVPVKDEGLLSYQLAFTVNGPYAAIKSYLSDLQKNPELVVVESVALTNSDLYTEDVAMELHITIFLREAA